MKRTPLKRYATLKRYTRLRKMSPKRKRDSVRYGFLRLGFLLSHPVCQSPGCNRRSVDVHHRLGRGIRLNDVQHFVAVCRTCHDHLHQHPMWARKHGLLG